MDFYNLKSIIAAQKRTIPMRAPTESFQVATIPERAYIEPTFSKQEFETEKPAVILVSAVGATGKSTLARVLSSQIGLPLLDLAKHDPVGDHTVTGLLTSAFAVEDLSTVFDAVRKGTFGAIIDGLDEGRSKTTEKAFHAFLEDIGRLCAGAANTSFVLLGRTQVLEECWIYLTDKKVDVGLILISPFGLDSARQYIDKFTDGLASPQANQYRAVRDAILNKLVAAFKGGTSPADESYLSFIGYPPVLDAIATLLQNVQNYHRVSEQLERPEENDVETHLLYRIASYILTREKEQKVIPNISSPARGRNAGPQTRSQSLPCGVRATRAVHPLGGALPLGAANASGADLRTEYQPTIRGTPCGLALGAPLYRRTAV